MSDNAYADTVDLNLITHRVGIAQQFMLIEPTVGRFDMQHEIAALAGTNVALAAYRSALDLPVHPNTPRMNVAWRSNLIDARQNVPKALGHLVIYDGYFRSDDPLPGLMYYSNRLVLKAIRKISKRAAYSEREPALDAD